MNNIKILNKNYNLFCNTFTKIRYSSTIYALSSGHGKCGVAVIRVSGKNAGDALKTMTKMNQLPKPRVALLKSIYHPQNNEILDKGLVLWFPGPKSFTGEDSCEFQIHGGLAVISSVLNALQTIPNLKPAEPGEFTRRAFDSGKMDLTEVEGLADLLQAETEMQRKQAGKTKACKYDVRNKRGKFQAQIQTSGTLGNLYNTWRSTLVKSVANIEACIDFEESEQLEDSNLLNSTFKPIETLYTDVQKHLSDGRKGEILRNGIKTVILGEPNAGKSSLFNILCQRPAAIVTPLEGTTRDILEITLDINGYPLVLTDTAGLRKNTADIIEKEGIKRALNSVEDANLIIFVLDVNKYVQINKIDLSDFIYDHIYNTLGLKELKLSDNSVQKCMFVLNKSDLTDLNTEKICSVDNKNICVLSCTTKKGLQSFIDTLTVNLQELCGTPSKEHPSMNKERHRYLLSSCSVYLEKFLSETENNDKDVVIMAQYLRSALRQLGKLTGKVTTEDLLDVIFKDFCIGK